MKIGLVIDDGLDRNDGVQQYVRTIGSWLEHQNHEVQFLAGETKKISKNIHSLSKNISMRFNGNRFTIPFAASTRDIQALLIHEQYDVLHVQMPYSPLLAGKIIKHAPKNIAIVGTFHILPVGDLQATGNYVLGKLQQRTLRRIDSICSVSQAAQKFAQDTYGITSKVVPNMIHLASWQKSAKPVLNKPGRIVFLGRLVARKGCREFLLAVAALPPAMLQNLEVIVAGDGPERNELKKLAHMLRLPCLFSGFIRESDKYALLASAQVAVFPSTGGESFGIVLLEAMAAGAGVVIGGDNAGYRSVLAGRPKSLIDFKETDAAAKNLLHWLTHARDAAELHRWQQQRVKQYDTEVVGPQVLQMYKDAVLSKQANVV